MGLLEQISEFLKRMGPRQKRKASRFGEQVWRAGWASRFGEQVDRFFSNKHSASELIVGLLEQISEFLKRMGPRQKRKASRFGEQVWRAGWASRFGEQVDRFFSNKHSASELILGLEQISEFLKRMEPRQKRKASMTGFSAINIQQVSLFCAF